MIRFLNLKNQIDEGVNDFAFFDTVYGRICTFDQQDVFDSLEDFTTAFWRSWERKMVSRDFIDRQYFERYLSVIPDGFFDLAEETVDK